MWLYVKMIEKMMTSEKSLEPTSNKFDSVK